MSGGCTSVPRFLQEYLSSCAKPDLSLSSVGRPLTAYISRKTLNKILPWMLKRSDASTFWYLGQFTLSRINVSSDYKDNLKSLKFLIAWTRNSRFAHTHVEKRGGSSLKYVFHMSSRNFDGAHTKFDFETRGGGLQLDNTAHLLLASTMSVAMPQTPRDTNPTIAILSHAYWRGQVK
jgi:hypothetical protein